MSSTIISFADKEDFVECNKFHNDYYKTERTLDAFEWEFVNKIDENKILISQAIFENELVGTQAIIPIVTVSKNGKYFTAKSEETLVSPKMRGKKIFEKLYDPLIEYCLLNKIQYIWGFTPADKAFKNAGFLIPMSTKQLFFSNNFFSLLSIAEVGNNKIKYFGFFILSFLFTNYSKVKFLTSMLKPKRNERLQLLESKNDIKIDWMQKFCEKWDVVTIDRSADYIDWRIFSNPHIKAIVVGYFKNDKLRGYVAFSMNDKFEGYIVDLITYDGSSSNQDGRVIKLLLKEATLRLKRMGSKSIRMWTFNSNKYDRLVKSKAQQLGYVFIKKGSPVLFRQTGNELSEGKSFGDWYVTRIFTEGVNG